ncbi:hypothetical protein [Streptomyces sp. NPDC056527]|uniref:hypothetical protein n=1 Tax=Streptomyces sp. NPDC056527 TaxID=3345853 RepID=UPI0036C6E177
MKRTRVVALLAAVLVGTASCSTNEGPSPLPQGNEGNGNENADDGDPLTRKVGETITISDMDGNPMRVTLTGVAYRNALAKDKSLPLMSYHAMAVALTLTSKTGGRLDGVTYAAIRWEGASGTVEERDYREAPWQNCTKDLSPFVEVEPGQTRKTITALNPLEKGGILIIEDSRGREARWELPDTDTGAGTEPATRYATADC